MAQLEIDYVNDQMSILQFNLLASNLQFYYNKDDKK